MAFHRIESVLFKHFTEDLYIGFKCLWQQRPERKAEESSIW
ncbi:uncharacterized protein METZ01_LOCUS395780, partial [marine metagenome]